MELGERAMFVEAADDEQFIGRVAELLGVTRVVMEATSDYWRPPFYLFEAHGLDPWLVNTKDVKHLPGPAHDRSWIHPIVYDAFVGLTTSTDALSRFGHALSDRTRTRVLLRLREEPACPSDLADELGVSRQSLSNHLSCLRGCGLVVAIPDGRRTRYELADGRIGHALDDLLTLVLVVDPECCGGEVIDVTVGAAASGVSAS